MDTPALKRQRSSDGSSENAREKGPCVLVLLQEENSGPQALYIIPMTTIKDELFERISQMADKAYQFNEDDDEVISGGSDDEDDDDDDDEEDLEAKEDQKENLREEKEAIRCVLEEYFEETFKETYKKYKFKQVEGSFLENVQQRIVQLAFIQLDDLRM